MKIQNYDKKSVPPALKKFPLSGGVFKIPGVSGKRLETTDRALGGPDLTTPTPNRVNFGSGTLYKKFLRRVIVWQRLSIKSFQPDVYGTLR